MSHASAHAESGADERPPESGASRRVASHWAQTWSLPVVTWAVAMASGSAWTLWAFSKGEEIRHFRGFTDFFWAVISAASEVGHGGLTHMYAGDGSVLVALPGFQLVLVAVTRVVTLLGLSAPAEGLARVEGTRQVADYIVGTGWLVIVPIAYAAAFAAIFPLDALGRRCGISGLRRMVLMMIIATALWWATVTWGHPEDGAAIALLAWAALGAIDGRWKSAGWLLGLGVAVQSLALLGAPILFLLAGIRRWPRMAVRVAVPSILAIAIPLVGDPHDTLRQVLEQPTYPLNKSAHLTPWIGVVPRPIPGVVYAGWPRTLAVILAVVVAILAMRRWGRASSFTPVTITWILGVSLSLRCVFESVLFPYYIVPPIAFLILAAFARQRWRAMAALAFAAGLGLLTRGHFGEWSFWALMVLGLGLLAALGFPAPAPNALTENGAAAPGVASADQLEPP